MIDNKEKKLYSILDLLGIKYERYEHPAIHTVEESKALEIYIPGKNCKNLFLKNNRGNIYYLLILDENKKVNFNQLSKQIGSSKLSFASEKKLMEYLNLTPGSVTPFGIINDAESNVILLIDKDIVGKERVNFHPNVNTATIGVSYDDLEKFFKWHNNKFYYVDIENI